MKSTWIGLTIAALALSGCDDGDNINSIPAQLTQYQTCNSLESDLKAHLVADINARYDQLK
ncbi:MAG: hypothetical protein KJO07_21790, partial [Deltaproteobacteria bacterium]|nr:hypothetical protein [Deltaproteobacteria bacterium]